MKQLFAIILCVLLALCIFANTISTEIPTDSSAAPFAGTNTKNDSETATQQQHQDGESVNVKADYASSVDENKKFVEVKVSKHQMQKYNFVPQVISENKILFLNAQNLAFYDRELKNPNLTVWLLSGGNEQKPNATLNYTIKRLFETAWNMNIQLKICDTNKFDLVISSEGLEHIMYDGVKGVYLECILTCTVEKLPDAVLPRLGAKVSYFSLAVVRQLEKMGVLIINELSSLEVSKDKLSTLQSLSAHNIPIPKTMIAKFPINSSMVANELGGYPIILKRSSGSQGKGVMLVQNAEHLNDIGDMIDTAHSYLLQEFIAKSAGRDIRVIVVGGKAIGGMMRIAKKGFKSNFHQGGYTKPVKLSTPIEWLAIKSANMIGLDIAGVDILIDKNTYRICEINSTPGFQGFEMATGIDVAKAIMEYVKFRCGIWKKTVRTTKSVVTVSVEAEHVMPPAPPKS
jgi:RimK family alpha-L-glutamate ligase